MRKVSVHRWIIDNYNESCNYAGVFIFKNKEKLLENGCVIISNVMYVENEKTLKSYYSNKKNYVQSLIEEIIYTDVLKSKKDNEAARIEYIKIKRKVSKFIFNNREKLIKNGAFINDTKKLMVADKSKLSKYILNRYKKRYTLNKYLIKEFGITENQSRSFRTMFENELLNNGCTKIKKIFYVENEEKLKSFYYKYKNKELVCKYITKSFPKLKYVDRLIYNNEKQLLKNGAFKYEGKKILYVEDKISLNEYIKKLLNN